MKPSTRARRVAAVLVVVFLLTSVWAAYYLYSEVRPANASSDAPSLASYSQNSGASFVAKLSPSVLYDNATQIDGGNITLFTPITHWINVTINYTVTVNRTVGISVVDAFTVTLATDAWKKGLYDALNVTDFGVVASAALTFTYSVNVTAVVALENQIDAEVDYQASAYYLLLSPDINAQLSSGSTVGSAAFAPVLNFTFIGSLITPNGLAHDATGQVHGPTPASKVSLATVFLPALLLVGSVGSLGGSAWVASRRPEDDRLPPLDDLIRPYEEAIADTARAPKEAVATSVSSFTDLVKIADTLGKPILRPMGPDGSRRTFFVLDGLLAYTYRYPAGGMIGSSGAATGTEMASSGWSPKATALIHRLQEESDRVRTLKFEPATVSEALSRIRRALDLIQAGNDDQAAIEVDQLSEMIVAAALQKAVRG